MQEPAPALANRKLIRNATVELEIVSFDNAVQRSLHLRATNTVMSLRQILRNRQREARGQVVVKVLPENLDRFLQKIRSLGELKNQTLGTEDVTKAYFDTERA